MSAINKHKNCIVIIFDDSYFEFGKNCLLSFRNYPEHPTIKVIYQGKDHAVLNFLSGLENVDLVDEKIDMSSYHNLNLGHIGSPIIYGRYVIWSSLFDEYDKVLYLDCDTLVLKPFPELFEKEDFFATYDNAGKPLFNRSAYQDKEFLSCTRADDIPHDLVNHMMINSGVLLVPRKYRTKKNFEWIHLLSTRYTRFIEHSDQSIISIWLYLQKIRISCDYRYNFMIDRITRPSFGNIQLEEVKILHFSYWKPDKNLGELLKKGSSLMLLKELIHNNSEFF